jgi:hypothetical protein
MMTLLAAVIFLAVIILALYVFGIFSTPYVEAFRFAFYFLLVMLALTIGIAVMQQPNQGYDPTVRTP